MISVEVTIKENGSILDRNGFKIGKISDDIPYRQLKAAEEVRQETIRVKHERK